MSIPKFEFTRNWTNPADFPTIETSEEQVRADLQALHDETKDYFNHTLMPQIEEELESTVEWTEQAVKDAVLGELPAESVTSEKLAPAAVGSEALADGAVSQEKLGDDVRAPNPQELRVGTQRYDGSEAVELSCDGMKIDSTSAAALGLGENATMNEALAALAPMLGGAQIQCGSYVGNGGVGSANPVVLSFDFVPMFVMVSQADMAPSFMETSIMVQRGNIWYEGVTQTVMLFNSGSGYKYWLKYSREGTTLKLWAESDNEEYSPSATYQLNTSGTTYAYIGIGVKEGA